MFLLTKNVFGSVYQNTFGVGSEYILIYGLSEHILALKCISVSSDSQPLLRCKQLLTSFFNILHQHHISQSISKSKVYIYIYGKRKTRTIILKSSNLKVDTYT